MKQNDWATKWNALAQNSVVETSVPVPETEKANIEARVPESYLMFQFKKLLSSI